MKNMHEVLTVHVENDQELHAEVSELLVEAWRHGLATAERLALDLGHDTVTPSAYRGGALSACEDALRGWLVEVLVTDHRDREPTVHENLHDDIALDAIAQIDLRGWALGWAHGLRDDDGWPDLIAETPTEPVELDYSDGAAK